MKFLIVGDVHLADRAPSIRTETYRDDILAKVRWCSEEAARRGCDALVQLGDIFHIKTPIRNSHGLVQATHEALRAGGLPVILIAGNHDIMHDRLESIPSQPIGALSRMEGIELLEGWHDKFPIFGIPYLADWSELSNWLDVWNATLKHLDTLYGDVTPLVIAHAPLFPPGQEPIYDYVDPVDWAAMQRTGCVSYGHIHDPHDVYVVDGVKFANFGAISRGSLHAETLKRKPQVAVYDAETAEYEVIPVPHKPAEEVFRLTEHLETKSKKEKMAAFLEGLGSDTLELTTVEKVLDDLGKLGLPDNALAIARELVEEAYNV